MVTIAYIAFPVIYLFTAATTKITLNFDLWKIYNLTALGSHTHIHLQTEWLAILIRIHSIWIIFFRLSLPLYMCASPLELAALDISTWYMLSPLFSLWSVAFTRVEQVFVWTRYCVDWPPDRQIRRIRLLPYDDVQPRLRLLFPLHSRPVTQETRTDGMLHVQRVALPFCVSSYDRTLWPLSGILRRFAWIIGTVALFFSSRPSDALTKAFLFFAFCLTVRFFLSLCIFSSFSAICLRARSFFRLPHNRPITDRSTLEQ